MGEEQGSGGNPSAIDEMAARLAEELARHCWGSPWSQLNDSERQMLASVCEGLLMDWATLERARNELLSPE